MDQYLIALSANGHTVWTVYSLWIVYNVGLDSVVQERVVGEDTAFVRIQSEGHIRTEDKAHCAKSVLLYPELFSSLY